MVLVPLVLVLVETQRSMAEICETSPSNVASSVVSLAKNCAPDISFGSIHDIMEKELESQGSCALQSLDGQGHGFEKATLEVKESHVDW